MAVAYSGKLELAFIVFLGILKTLSESALIFGEEGAITVLVSKAALLAGGLLQEEGLPWAVVV